jgi:hypothetical protein
MAMAITLTDPTDKKRPVTPSKVTMVFFSELLSPPAARRNLIYQGAIRSFKETPQQAVNSLSEHIKLLKLTLPKKEDTLSQDIWINTAFIEKVNSRDKGAVLKLSGQKGTVTVLESKEHIDEAVNGV